MTTTFLSCNSEDLKIKPQSVCVLVGCSSTGKSHKIRSILLNPHIFFVDPPVKVLYVHKFTEPEHDDLSKFYKRNIKFIRWPLLKRKKPTESATADRTPSLADYLRPRVPSGGILVLDDVQTDLEKSFDNVMFGTALAHHANVTILVCR